MRAQKISAAAPNSHKIKIHVYILNFVISGLTIWDVDTIFGDLGVNVYQS
jgi:hypothetical protein